jgi:hypothetical protein
MMDIFDAAGAIAAARGRNETTQQVLEAAASMLKDREDCVRPDEIAFFLERGHWAGDPEGIGEHLQGCADCRTLVRVAKGGAA